MKTIIAIIATFFMTPYHSGAEKLDRKEAYCLARAVYHEARGEPIKGQYAVAHVIMNRVKSLGYPTTICKVIFQPKQFSHISDTNPDESSQAWYRSVQSAISVYVGGVKDPTNGALYFYAHDVVEKPSWAYKMKVSAKIGGHTFLKRVM